MSTELISVLVLLVVVSLLLLVLDAAVAGVLAWLSPWAFWRCFRWGLWALLLPPLLMGWGTLVERNLCRVNRIEVPVDGLPAAFDGYRIVHLSDIHSRSFQGRTRALQRMVEKANALDADLVAFTGDIVTLDPEELDYTAPILGGLKAHDAVVAVPGNHDYCIYHDRKSPRRGPLPHGLDRICDAMQSMGWEVLRNGSRIISRGGDSLAVVGTENISSSTHFPTTGNLEKALEGTDGMCRLLLTHDPTCWPRQVVGKNVALTLSGHTHAAQVTLLGWSPSQLIYKYYRGLYREGNQYLYINVGLGETIFPARIACPPEITLITLRKSRGRSRPTSRS